MRLSTITPVHFPKSDLDLWVRANEYHKQAVAEGDTANAHALDRDMNRIATGYRFRSELDANQIMAVVERVTGVRATRLLAHPESFPTPKALDFRTYYGRKIKPDVHWNGSGQPYYTEGDQTFYITASDVGDLVWATIRPRRPGEPWILLDPEAKLRPAPAPAPRLTAEEQLRQYRDRELTDHVRRVTDFAPIAQRELDRRMFDAYHSFMGMPAEELADIADREALIILGRQPGPGLDYTAKQAFLKAMLERTGISFDTGDMREAARKLRPAPVLAPSPRQVLLAEIKALGQQAQAIVEGERFKARVARLAELIPTERQLTGVRSIEDWKEWKKELEEELGKHASAAAPAPAPAALPALKLSTVDPTTMTGAQLQKEDKQLDEIDSGITQRLIARGHGHWHSSDVQQAARSGDALAIQAEEVGGRRALLRFEAERRAGSTGMGAMGDKLYKTKRRIQPADAEPAATHRIHTERGAQTVPTAAKRGLYALHKSTETSAPPGMAWVVTHLPTGLAVRGGRTREDAMAVLKHFAEHAGDAGATATFGDMPDSAAMTALAIANDLWDRSDVAMRSRLKTLLDAQKKWRERQRASPEFRTIGGLALFGSPQHDEIKRLEKAIERYREGA